MSDVGDVLAIIRQAGLSTVQDVGRPGFSDIAVARTGAWHRSRYDDAVRLVHAQARPQAPSIELLAGALLVEMTTATCVSVVGPADVFVDECAAPIATAVMVEPGSLLRVDHRGVGPVYVALAGWVEPTVLGSCSTDLNGGIGGRRLVAGDELAGIGDTREVGAFLRREDPSSDAIRVVAVGDPSDPSRPWLASQWRVAAASRSGTRLAGGSEQAPATMPSAPVVVGAIQLTPAGEAIILGPDGGLTGGYPVSAVVISADLDRVSELAIGQDVHLRAISVEQAHEVHQRSTRGGQRRVVRAQRLGQEPLPG